jgi:excisionase family DNA binding protein
MEKKMEIEPLTVSVSDAARALGIGRTTAYLLITRGDLKVVRLGRRTLVRTDSIRALVDA